MGAQGLRFPAAEGEQKLPAIKGESGISTCCHEGSLLLGPQQRPKCSFILPSSGLSGWCQRLLALPDQQVALLFSVFTSNWK